MISTFNDFINCLIVENLHPELQEVARSKTSRKLKQSLLAAKIKDLTNRGERTGIEGNMPKGSSRAFLRHEEPHEITLDGKQSKIKTGTKVAIRATLDAHHNKDYYGGLSLGQMQNRAEGANKTVNKKYRILTKNERTGEFSSNKEKGIFPPLIEHDHDNHEWSHVGQARDIKAGEFRELTKSKEHPKGISHGEFVDALNRNHERKLGKYWERDNKHESKLDHIEKHPLVQKFMDYHNKIGHPTYDYQQIKNLGVFEHPDGSRHIIARDHGYDTSVHNAYMTARIRGA